MTKLLSAVADRELGADDLSKLVEDSDAPTSAEISALPKTTGKRVGDFEVLGEIGRGGMGVVYLARQPSLGRLVALKMLPAELAGDLVALGRFQREMRTLGRLDHPNIVKVLACVTPTDGQLYYAMEYVPGCNLEQAWRELTADGLRVVLMDFGLAKGQGRSVLRQALAELDGAATKVLSDP